MMHEDATNAFFGVEMDIVIPEHRDMSGDGITPVINLAERQRILGPPNQRSKARLERKYGGDWDSCESAECRELTPIHPIIYGYHTVCLLLKPMHAVSTRDLGSRKLTRFALATMRPIFVVREAILVGN
jgi:hypothetical protein